MGVCELLEIRSWKTYEGTADRIKGLDRRKIKNI